jgi:transcriptional regulator with XRE-family HTH domain
MIEFFKKFFRGVPYMSLGTFIRNSRLNLNLSLYAFCKHYNLDPNVWSKVERDLLVHPPTKEQIKKIAEMLRIPEHGPEMMEKLASYTEYNFKLAEKDLIQHLPILIGGENKEPLSEEKLHQLVESIKQSHIPYDGDIFKQGDWQ